MRRVSPTITVSAVPAEGALASQVPAAAMPKLKELERELPPGYRMEIAGEQEAQEKGFGQVAVALLNSVALRPTLLQLPRAPITSAASTTAAPAAIERARGSTLGRNTARITRISPDASSRGTPLRSRSARAP